MPLFAIVCRDRAGAADARKAATQAHLAHVEANMARYRVAGPLRDDDGVICGSLLIIEARDADDARSFLAADPYHAAGIWGSVSIDAFYAAAGTWVGGAAWKA
jgi:hypothetical protein